MSDIMPYITQEQRDEIDEDAAPIFRNAIFYTLGELNYLITKLLMNTRPACYADYDELIGLLECVKLEFYRCAVAEYEDRKKEKNGDVYRDQHI